MTDDDRERMIRIEALTESNHNNLGILFKAIEGNGQPGLKQRMTAVEVAHEDCRRRQQDAPNRSTAVSSWASVVVMVVTAIIMIWVA